MRNMLVLSALASLMTQTALADTPKVTLGGIINAQAGFTSQDDAFDANTRDYGFRNDSEIHVNIEASAPDLSLTYGATIELEADVTADARDEGLNADKTFVWAESGFGRFELGNNEGAESAMVVNAASIAKATGGIDGDDEFFINATGLAGTAAFLIHPDLPTADTGGITEDATKISYYTPRFSGFQLGVSYTPDEGDGGQTASRNDINGDYENVWSGGLSYEADYETISVAAALVAEIGDSEANINEDLGAWQAGLQLGFLENWSVAGSYGDWYDSGMARGSNLETDFWTLGGAYDAEKWGTSLTLFNSTRGTNDYESVSLGAEYLLAPGLVPYVDVSFFEADEAGVARDNDGTVVLIGTYLNF